MSMPRWLTEARGLRADLIALLAGALAALALPPLAVLPALLVSFPILLVLINAAGRPIVAARRGWWFGFGYHLIGLYWITEAILFEAARFWWLVPLAVPAVAAVLAVFIAVPAWIAWFGVPRDSRVPVQRFPMTDQGHRADTGSIRIPMRAGPAEAAAAVVADTGLVVMPMRTGP